MTQTEALRLALGALEDTNIKWPNVVTAIQAVKKALETKDEPIAWGMEKDGVIIDVICPAEHEREEGEYTIPLYTHPKKWVGLTEEEVKECFTITPDQFLPWHIYKRIEDKLKEKNHG